MTSDPKNEDVLGVEIETDGFVYEGIHVPALLAKIRARDDGLDIDSVQTQYAGGDLALDGHVEYEGITEIHVRGKRSGGERGSQLPRVRRRTSRAAPSSICAFAKRCAATSRPRAGCASIASTMERSARTS